MGKTDCAVIVFGTKNQYCLDHKNTKKLESNSVFIGHFPVCSVSLQGERVYYLNWVLNSCCSSGCWEMLGYES
jgi:hypothetical protein